MKSMILSNDSSGVLNALVANGSFANLPASIRIEERFTFDQCSNLWDNTGACCGENKGFSFELGISCNATSKNLVDMGLKSLTIDAFELTESIAGIDLPAVDITKAVHDALVGVLNGFLEKPFISYNGT